ncbi:MAG: GNAT family N-acetyltransferase, partial [Kofleriaceae bacterium]
MSTPELQLATLYETDACGRLTTTREPTKHLAPMFALVRSKTATAWGIRAGVPDALAEELAALARDESPLRDLHDLPKYVGRYRELGTTEYFGPAFEFPDVVAIPSDILLIEDERALNVNFRGWVRGEIAAGRAPVMSTVVDGYPVSVCFCARRSLVAAEAGVDTAPAYRGRGYAALVTAAWALAMRASGRIPL